MAVFDIKINGISYRTEKDISFTVNGNGQTISNIKVLVDKGKPIPRANDKIEVFYDSTIIFLGYAGLPTSPKFATGHEVPLFTIPTNNANKIVANRVYNKAFASAPPIFVTINDIIDDILTNILAEENVTAGRIDDNNTTFTVYTASDTPLQSVLDELAEFGQSVWFIDEKLKFNFINVNEMDINLIYNYTEQTKFGTLQVKNNGTDFRNVQIERTRESTDLQTEAPLVDVDTSELFTIYPVLSAEPAIPRPVVKVNTIPQQVGVNGFDNENPANIFLYTAGSTQISVNQNSGFAFLDTDIVSIEYFGQFDIRLTTTNFESVNLLADKTGNSGKIENVNKDKTSLGVADALTKASAKLAKYSKNKIEVTIEVKESDLIKHGLTRNDIKLFNVINFQFPRIEVENAKFVIKEITTQVHIVGSEIEPICGMNGELKFVIKLISIDDDFLKNYGEVFYKYQKDIDSLSVRDDENVLSGIDVVEETNLSEEYFFFQPLTVFCNDFSEGHIYSPSDILGYGVEFASYI